MVRVERSGIRCCLDAATAMLDPFCVYLNDQWEDFMTKRIDNENARLYPPYPSVPQFHGTWPVEGQFDKARNMGHAPKSD